MLTQNKKGTISNIVSRAFQLTSVLVLALAGTTKGMSFPLDGIGYREQELQVAKGSFFNSETPNGISYASFAGGTNIFIKGQELATNAQSNVILMYSQDLEKTVQAPLLTEDDAFQSNTDAGFITYRLPSPATLLGVDERVLDQYSVMYFELRVWVEHDLYEPYQAVCSSTSKCMVKYDRGYTPIVYEFKPPVVYYDSITNIWFDPKNTINLIQDLPQDEMHFINAKIGGALMDFEGFVDFDRSYSKWYRNQVSGRVGDQPPSASHNMSMLWEIGHSNIQKQESLTCSYDNSTCYQAKTVPVIFSQSSNTGFTTGGQELTVTGWGFNSGNIDAKVDGVDCEVTSYSKDKFTCKVKESAAASVIDNPQMGQHGVRQTIVNSTQTETTAHVWYNNLDGTYAGWTKDESLALTMESPENRGDHIGYNFKGWFIAPETTRYRFYLSCNDACMLEIDLTSGSNSDLTKILEVTGASGFREFWRANDGKTRISEWVDLTQGEHYYIEASHGEWSSGDHVSVGVEIEQTAIVGHHHAMKEIQNLKINVDNQRDTVRVEIENADDGEYILNFQNPADLKYVSSSPIKAKATANQFKDACNRVWCYNKAGSWCDANLTMYDADGVVTTDDDLSVKRVYHLILRRLRDSASTTNILVAKTTSTATITALPPSQVQLSSKPLSGKYKIKCVDKDGFESFSSDIKYSTSENWIANEIMYNCDGLYDRIEVLNSYRQPYRQNGVDIFIRFLGVNEDPGQFEIMSADDEPLDGGNVTFESLTVQPYSTNIFYEPIPFEMLKTFETKPQLIVSVDGLPAVCHNLTCDYTYTVPVGEVTSFTFDDASSSLVLTGTGFDAEITKVEFALSDCTVDASTLSATNLECTLASAPTCGEWKPILTSSLGIIPNAIAMTATTVSCAMTAGTPATDLNLLGGDSLEFVGTNLPHDLERSVISVAFDDTQATLCVPTSTTATKLICVTDSFDQSVSSGATITPVVTINGVTATHTLTFTMKTEIKSGTSITPDSVSPVLKSSITVTLENDFPHTLAKEDLTMWVTNAANSSIVKQVNVVSVDDSAKTFVAMFGGAESGTFNVGIRHATFGLVGTAGLTLTVGSTVTSVSPMTGSINGGTILTITGTNFGTQKTDNPVQISYNGGVGSHNCFVLTTIANQITCQIDDTITQTAAAQGEVIVFLKTSEEATCASAVCGGFTFTDSIPTITAAETQFDAATGKWELKVTGTSFELSGQKLMVGSVEQTLKAGASVTEVVFTLDALESTNVRAKLTFGSGKPNGHAILDAGIDLTARFMSVSPSSGSSGSSTIVINAPGAVKTSQITVQSGANDLCSAVRVPSYGVVECDTNGGDFAQAELKINDGTSEISCSNSDSTQCEYTQAATGFPAVTSAAIVGSTIVFTGTDFFTAGHVAVSSFNGVSASSVVIDSATQATATWDLGVPTAVALSKPVLKFNVDGSVVSHTAVSTFELLNAISVTANTQGLTCSFAGGCELEITADGLSSMLKSKSDSYVSVCEKRCEFVESLSTASAAKCLLPAVSTKYSDSTFGIQTSHKLSDFIVTSTASADEHNKLFDGDLIGHFDDSSSSCEVTAQFRSGHIAVLDKVKIFFDRKFDKADTFIGKLKFQGSMDGVSFTDILTIDENARTGFNYFEWSVEAERPSYTFYRFAGSATNACAINEAELWGIETIDDQATSFDCQPKLVNEGADVALTGTVQYQGAMTAALDSISPRYGKVEGGDTVTFTGTGFSTTQADYSIIIDGIDCPVSAATVTSVSCVTGPRPGLVNSSLSISITGSGSVSLRGKLFRYVNAWSSDVTWGGEFAPIEGDSVHVPAGLNLLVDVDSTPLLNAVIVEGSLIFAPHETDPTHQRTFDAKYIFVNHGKFECGTEEHPYTSKVTITMHGLLADPYLPIYGNKVLALRHGTLDMHGPERTRTWTQLETTADAGALTITLKDSVDWVAGEQIAIAPTSYEAREAEKRTILSIDNSNADKPIITLDKALDFKHFAMTQTYGSEEIDMRAEVGLLSRNVVFRGDPETSEENEYGATVFLHSMGDDSLTARLANVEFTDMGQAFKLGRYAIHFHMIGNVHNSYIKGNSVHQSFNRAFTMHGTNFLRITENVVYNVKGHNIFIEDAVERFNQIHNNLIMMTKRSMSLLNTDSTPASMWITNPNNDFTGNHAAGSDRYSYWYDLQIHAMGPNADTDVCPENERVGRFFNNTAHSNGRYGLRIFHNMMPRQFPCKPITYDFTNQADPFHSNPLITAEFEELTSWKNKRNGAIAGKVADVRFKKFKTADNVLAGIEFERSDVTAENKAGVYDCLVIGKSLNTEQKLELASPHGIISPRSENFTIDNVRFYGYDWNDAAALGDCSHCFHPAATDSGARQVVVRNLFFDSTVLKKIKYQFPFLGIFKDETGELTGKGPNSWAMGYVKAHEAWSECETDLDVFDGHICDNTVEVRRLAYHGADPFVDFFGQGLFILPYDDDYLATISNQTEWMADRESYGKIKQKEKLDPMKSWTFPFVTGHKYHIHWSITGVDWTDMKIERSEKWLETDKSVYIVNNFTDIRAKMDVNVGQMVRENLTIGADEASRETGQYILYNDTEVREFHYVMNGKNNTRTNELVTFKAHRCDGPCNEDVAVVATENRTRYWSNTADWPEGEFPEEGKDVIIQPGWNMIYDLEESPIYKVIQINGILTFKNESDAHLHAEHIFVRAGELHIGSPEFPFLHKAKITLHGSRNMESIVYDNAIEAGNKVLANVNVVQMHGIKRTKHMTRLHAEAIQGATSITVETGLDLIQGDRLALAPTGYDYVTSEEAFVQAYDTATGVVTLVSPLLHYHWGSAVSTANKYNGADIRGEVLILSRNIVIAGEDLDTWGGQIVTSDTIEVNTLGEVIMRQGVTVMHNVEIYNCSQMNTQKGALRWEGAAGKYSHIKGVSLHNGHGWTMQIKSSANVKIEESVAYHFKPIGMAIRSSNNITLHRNIIVNVHERGGESFEGQNVADRRGAISVCAIDDNDRCENNKVTENIVAGAAYAGFLIHGHKCGDYTQHFKGNVAHSVKGFKGGTGAIIFPNGQTGQDTGCMEGSYFTAYKCFLQGIFSFDKGREVRMSHLTMIDNVLGAGAQLVGKGEDQYLSHKQVIQDSMFYGESEIPDCPHQNKDSCIITKKFAVFPGTAAQKGKVPHITGASSLPIQKIKGDPSWNTANFLYRNTFTGFKAKTQTGKSNSIFGSSHYQPDYTPIMQIHNSKFIDIEEDSVSYFDDPNPSWANLKDCGDFPCTAPLNILYEFKDSVWEGQKPSWAATNFQLIANNSGFAPHIPECTPHPNMNTYSCQKKSLSILHFESKDADFMDRAVQPVYTKMQGTEISNKLNAQMDHVWDGFYTGQLRQTRFPSIIDAGKGSTYDITYTGTPPKKQVFELYSMDPEAEVVVRIAYPSAVAYEVQVAGARVEMNQWSDLEKNYGPIKRTSCGENRYLAVQNILEFYLKRDCTITIQPRNAIMTKVRMEWTVEDFYAKGGTTTFVDRIAASLGIHASTIKVVGVYEGSLIVDYNIFSDTNDNAQLQTIQAAQVQQIATGTLDLGAPVLDFENNAAPVVKDGVVAAAGYDPVIITPTATNSGANYQATSSQTAVPTNTAQSLEQSSSEKSDFQADITIVEANDPQTQQKSVEQRVEQPGADSMVFILVALGILCVLCVAFGVRTLVRFTQLQAIDAEKMKQGREDFNHVTMNTDFGTAQKASAMEMTETVMENSDAKMVKEYAEQYDANHDFAIFGVGNNKQGGVQSLADKMNMADNVEREEAGSPVESTNSNSKGSRGPSPVLPENEEIVDL